MIKRKKYWITPLCESGKGKFISGAADFGTAAWRGHGFHTRPNNSFFPQWNSLSPSAFNSQTTESSGHSSFSKNTQPKDRFLDLPERPPKYRKDQRIIGKYCLVLQRKLLLINEFNKKYVLFIIWYPVMSPNIARPLTLRTSPSDYAKFNQKNLFWYLVSGCFWKEKNSNRFSL